MITNARRTDGQTWADVHAAITHVDEYRARECDREMAEAMYALNRAMSHAATTDQETAIEAIRDAVAELRIAHGWQETPKVPTFSDLWVCQECYWMHTYGVIGNGPSTFDTTSVDEYLRRQAEVADAYRTANDQGQLSDNVDSETGEGIRDFSWSACECCGSTLGGARYRLAQRDA